MITESIYKMNQWMFLKDLVETGIAYSEKKTLPRHLLVKCWQSMPVPRSMYCLCTLSADLTEMINTISVLVANLLNIPVYA